MRARRGPSRRRKHRGNGRRRRRRSLSRRRWYRHLLGIGCSGPRRRMGRIWPSSGCCRRERARRSLRLVVVLARCAFRACGLGRWALSRRPAHRRDRPRHPPILAILLSASSTHTYTPLSSSSSLPSPLASHHPACPHPPAPYLYSPCFAHLYTLLAYSHPSQLNSSRLPLSYLYYSSSYSRCIRRTLATSLPWQTETRFAAMPTRTSHYAVARACYCVVARLSSCLARMLPCRRALATATEICLSATIIESPRGASSVLLLVGSRKLCHELHECLNELEHACSH